MNNCPKCDAPLLDGEPTKLVRSRYDSGVEAMVHVECTAEALVARRVRLERERQQHEEERRQRQVVEQRRCRLDLFDQRFAESCVGAKMSARANGHEQGWLIPSDSSGGIYATGTLRFPRWKWSRFDNQEFRARVDSRLLRAVEVYDETKTGSLVLCAPTGRGKSALVSAWIWRRHDELRARVESGEKLGFWFAWVSGFELAGARRRSELGDESPLVKHASTTPLLILDEVGQEPASEETFVVLDARYREGLPTIITSPLVPAALMTHLGGGAYRRVLEHGALVEAFGEMPKAKASVRVVR